MSSKIQLNNYVNKLKSEIARIKIFNRNLQYSLDNDKRIIDNLHKTIREKNAKIESFEQAIKTSKKWYQIIIRI